jgi:hypothetical protein
MLYAGYGMYSDVSFQDFFSSIIVRIIFYFLRERKLMGLPYGFPANLPLHLIVTGIPEIIVDSVDLAE